MRIDLASPDPSWADQFLAEKEHLRLQLAAWLVGDPEHVGSTAVEGLWAKPIIDIMAPVRSLEQARPAIAVAEALGYCHYPYRPDVMHWFCKPSPAHRTHHLYLVPLNGDLWRDRILFRDLLRSDPSTRSRYQVLKSQLAERHPTEREAYTEGKSAFIAEVLRLARDRTDLGR